MIIKRDRFPVFKTLADLGQMGYPLLVVLVPFGIFAWLILAVPQIAEAIRISATEPNGALWIVILLTVYIVGVWTWSRIVLRAALPEEQKKDPQVLRPYRGIKLRTRLILFKSSWRRPWLYRNLPPSLAVALAIVFAVAVLQARLNSSELTPQKDEAINVALYWLAFDGALIALVAVGWNHVFKRAYENDAWKIVRQVVRYRIPIAALGGTVSISFSLLMMAISARWPSISSTVSTSVGIIEAGFAFWTALLSGTLLLSYRWKLPLFKVVAAGFLVFGLLDLKDIRRVPSVRKKTPYKNVQAVFRNWLAARPDAPYYKGQPYPVFIVCAEGGGIRAAYHTAATLSAIQDRWPGFSGHVFAISSVSGGSLGAAVFAAQISSRLGPKDRETKADERSFADETDDVFKQDLLSPVVGRLLFLDTVQSAIPLPLRFSWCDRSQALSQALADGWANSHEGDATMSLPISDLYGAGGAESCVVPSLCFNTTGVERGDRVVLSNLALDLEEAAVKGKPVRPDPFKGLRSLGNPSGALNGSSGDTDVSLAVGSTLSARFPLVTTSGELIVGDSLVFRLVDGGYVDNSGVATGMEIAKAMDATPIKPGESRLLASQIPYRLIFVTIGSVTDSDLKTIARKYGTANATSSSKDGADKKPKRVGIPFEETLSPLRAVLSGYLNQNALPYRDLSENLGQLATAGESPPIHFYYAPGVLLGWTLSDRTKETLRWESGSPPRPTTDLHADEKHPAALIATYNEATIQDLFRRYRAVQR